jgi:isopentenyl diphosphate isomerase/L-lactate dehydrogenase-like FMN-dependent dehydrogenase
MASTDDLRAAAHRRMPRFAFDYFDGAAEGEAAMARNRAAFDACVLTLASCATCRCAIPL